MQVQLHDAARQEHVQLGLAGGAGLIVTAARSMQHAAAAAATAAAAAAAAAVAAVVSLHSELILQAPVWCLAMEQLSNFQWLLTNMSQSPEIGCVRPVFVNLGPWQLERPDC